MTAGEEMFMEKTSKIYTKSEIESMFDSELNIMAGRLQGWHVNHTWWVDDSGKHLEFNTVSSEYGYFPTKKSYLSRRLLDFTLAYCDGECVITISQTKNSVLIRNKYAVVEVDGVSPRSETIACILMLLQAKGLLKDE